MTSFARAEGTDRRRAFLATTMIRKLGLLLVVVLSIAASCQRAPSAPKDAPKVPTLRLYFVSTAAGALEPCGCTTDQLGGVQHAAALVHAEAKDAPSFLVLGAGPMLFLDPTSDPQHATQDLWKAEALASGLGAMGLSGWAPGQNDWAAGPDALSRLAGLAKADLLAGNLGGSTAGARATRLVEVNGIKVGIAGVSEPTGPLGAPAGVSVGDAKATLATALAELKQQGAQVLVALVAADRGRALRLAEQVPGYTAMLVGKPYDRGDGNDAVTPPLLIGDTVVVETPNHLQGVAMLDLFVRGAPSFKDGTGIAQLEARESLESRIRDLKLRIEDAESRGAAAADVVARKADLAKLEQELAALPQGSVPAEGSFFRYREEPITQSLGTVPALTTRLDDYYRRVNDHNREAFKDRLPPPARAGDATYIGAAACGSCHDDAYDFWQRTPHATAYASLSTQHKEFNLDCVGCHVTGYEKPGGSTVTHVADLMNVQCESCHGPGSLHEKDPADTTTLVRSPPKSLCAPACHHPPHVHEGWDVDAAWKVIIGRGHGQKS